VVSRIALLLAGVAASAVLTVALAAAGFAPAPSASPGVSGPTAPTELTRAAVPDPGPQATTQIDTVYVRPAATPETIRILKTAPPRPPVIVRKVVRSGGGDNGGESDGESDEGDD
jgi:hypothetical protein